MNAMTCSRDKYGLALAAVLLLAVLALFSHRPAAEPVIYTFPEMGTVAEFVFFAAPETAEAARRDALAEFGKIKTACNRYDAGSELARLNRSPAGRIFRCSDTLAGVLERAFEAYRKSGGLFDVTVDPLMKLWGFYEKKTGRMPSADEIAGARARVGLDKTAFDSDKKTFTFRVSGMSVDLGGIAKGYAVDAAYRAALARGVTGGVINLGGNLRFLPQPPAGEKSYLLALKNPEKTGENLDCRISVPGGYAVSTSGDYERFVKIGGKRFGHLINPVTGLPSRPRCAVTVIAPDAVTADWMSSAVFVAEGKIPETLKGIPGCRILIYDGSGILSDTGERFGE